MKVPDYGIPTDQSEQGQMPSRAQMLMAVAMNMKGRQPLSPDVLGEQMSGSGMSLGGAPARPPGTGFKELEAVRTKTEQEQIKENLPPPKSELQKAREHDEKTGNIMDNDSLWAIARDSHASQEERMGFGVPFSKVLSDTVKKVLGRDLTPEEASKAIIGAAKYGIGQ